jgi:phospholipid transport system substrate-binding protein
MAFMALLASGAAVSAQPGPVEVLQGMSDQVLAIVEKDPEVLNDKPRMRKIAEDIVVPNIDFVLFSQWVLGKNWRNASPQQRNIFIKEFRELLINSYIGSITRDDYQNQTIRYKPLRKEHDPEKVTVEAEVEQPNGPIIEVQFRMRLKGVSLVATHRSSFSNIIRDKGIDGLITMLEEKNIGGKSGETPAASTTPQ